MSLPGKPGIRNAPRASPNTLEYYWFPPADTGGNLIEGYQLSINPGAITCNIAASELAPTFGYYKVTGLSNATTYFTTIAASTINGYGPTANFRAFQPGSPPLLPPSTTSIVVSGQSNALISWTPPITSPNATIFWYTIKSKSSNPADPVLKYTANGQTQSNYFIKGLNSNSTYTFTVNAVNCPGYSPSTITNSILYFYPDIPNPSIGAITAGYPTVLSNSLTYSLTLTGVADMWAARNNAPILYKTIPSASNWILEAEIQDGPAGIPNQFVGGLVMYPNTDGSTVPIHVGWTYWSGNKPTFEITGAGPSYGTGTSDYSQSFPSAPAVGINYVGTRLIKTGNVFTGQWKYPLTGGWSNFAAGTQFTWTTLPPLLRVGLVAKSGISSTYVANYRNISVTYT
jgi:hypothetical protein